jgi:ankyrin repeat protein
MVAVSCTIVRTRAELVPLRGFPPEMSQAQLGAPLRLTSLPIEKGAEVNAARQDGRTVLMSAVMVGWPEIVAILLRHHADVDACWWGWGNTTTEALRRFQRDHAIAVTGQFDDASVKALGLNRSQ